MLNFLIAKKIEQSVVKNALKITKIKLNYYAVLKAHKFFRNYINSHYLHVICIIFKKANRSIGFLCAKKY